MFQNSTQLSENTVNCSFLGAVNPEFFQFEFNLTQENKSGHLDLKSSIPTRQHKIAGHFKWSRENTKDPFNKLFDFIFRTFEKFSSSNLM